MTVIVRMQVLKFQTMQLHTKQIIQDRKQTKQDQIHTLVKILDTTLPICN